MHLMPLCLVAQLNICLVYETKEEKNIFIAKFISLKLNKYACFERKKRRIKKIKFCCIYYEKHREKIFLKYQKGNHFET